MTKTDELASKTGKKLLEDLGFSAPELFYLHIEKRMNEVANAAYEIGYAEGESSREADFQALYEEGFLNEYLEKYYG